MDNAAPDRLRAVTIVDVAREANVSIRTVSRVLNGGPYVSADKHERVRAVIDRLGFVPSANARALAGPRTYTLALLYQKLSANYLMEVQPAAVRTCRAHGYRLIVEELVPEDLDSEAQASKALGSLNIDGAVILPPVCDDPALLAALDALEIRFSRVAPAIDAPPGSAVLFDDAGATEAMVRHLVSLGHRDIGFIVGNIGHVSARRRLEAFRATHAALGLAERPEWIVPGDYSFDSGVAAGRLLLELPTPPTAIFAANDAMAAGVIAAAGMKGLFPPRDVSICGFDDNLLSRQIWPPLTTIRQPLAEMVTAAFEQLLVPHLDGARSFAFTLVARASTTKPRNNLAPCPGITDPGVSVAVQAQ